MHHAVLRYMILGSLLSVAVSGLSACGSSPADFGITGPMPGQNLNPPPPTQAQINPDASSVIPGVQTGNDSFTPSILNAPAQPGKFFGSD